MDSFIIDNPTINITDATIDAVEFSTPDSILTISFIECMECNQEEQVLKLIVNENTFITDLNGMMLSVTDLEPGITIDTLVSSVMTRSNPPQTNAFIIQVTSPLNNSIGNMPSQDRPFPNMPNRPDSPIPGPGPIRPGNRPEGPGRPGRPGSTPPPRPLPSSLSSGIIIDIDRANRNFTTINGLNLTSIIRFNVPENTIIIGKNGRTNDFSALMPGQRVMVRHANFMTASIPPQTTAFEVRVL